MFSLTSDWPAAGLHDDGRPHDGNGQCGVWLWKLPAHQGLVKSNAQALTHLRGLGLLHLGGQLLHGDTAHHGDGVEGGVDGVRGLAQDKVRLHGATVKARGASLSRSRTTSQFRTLRVFQLLNRVVHRVPRDVHWICGTQRISSNAPVSTQSHIPIHILEVCHRSVKSLNFPTGSPIQVPSAARDLCDLASTLVFLLSKDLNVNRQGPVAKCIINEYVIIYLIKRVFATQSYV